MHQRFCKVCQGWHDLDQPWPHNCLPERNLAQSDFAAPLLIKPMPDYRSPVDGKLITSRHARREDLKRSGCVEWDPGTGQGRYKRTPGVINNPKYEASGFKLSEKGQMRKEQMRKGATYAEVIAAEAAGKRT